MSAPVILRPYQEQMQQAWFAARDRGIQRGLIVAATGTGKTTVFWSILDLYNRYSRAFSGMILAHRQELLSQAMHRGRSQCPMISVGIESGDSKASIGTQVVCASVQSVGIEGSTRLDWLGPQIVVCDEGHHACFVAGTLVDGIPIERVRVGDYVWSRGAHVEQRRVTAVMKHVPSLLVRLSFSNGASFVCTHNHPIYSVDKHDYIPAIRLREGENVYARLQEVHQANALCYMWDDLHAKEPKLAKSPLLLRGMQECCKGSKKDTQSPSVPRVWERGSFLGSPELRVNAKGTCILLNRVQGEVLVASELNKSRRNEPNSCIYSNDSPQPNEEEECSRCCIQEVGRESPCGERGEWAFDRSARSLDVCLEGSSQCSSGVCREDTQCKGSVYGASTCCLQDRYSATGENDCNRGGRENSLRLKSEGSGRLEDEGLRVAWLECIEVLEPGSDGTFGGVCPEGFVYNFSVDSNENYFAEGILVHNCAKTYQNTFRRFGCYQEGGTDLLGVTATPHRLDQLALYGSEKAIFQEIVFTYDIVRAIKDGFLVDLRGFRAAADIDLSKVKDFQGDYALGQLEKAMNTAPITELAFKSWSEVASDRQTIIFCSGVDHAKDVAKVFGEHGIKAEAIYGDMNPSLRQAAIARFQKGETQILTNMDILTEGFDAQHCACVILLRPTKSWSLFVQMVGRGLRTLPGIIEGIGEPMLRRAAISQSKKPDCLVIDIVSNTGAHSLTGKPESKDIPSLAGIVGLPSALDMEGLTVAQAVEQFESLPDMLKAAAWRGRNTSFSGLTATLTQVEMLSELAVPEEVEEAGARLHWLKTGDLEYLLDIGNEIGSPINRKATLTGDIIGNWTLRMMAFDHERTFRDECRQIESVDTRELFRIAEQMIKSCFPGVSRSADAKAPWRSGKPTASQILDLKAFGITDDAINELNKGQASAMLNMLERRQQGGS